MNPKENYENKDSNNHEETKDNISDLNIDQQIENINAMIEKSNKEISNKTLEKQKRTLI